MKLGKIKTSCGQTKLLHHSVRIIVIQKKWLLQIEQRICMIPKTKGILKLKGGNNASYPFGFM